jgi:hypothetical protein
VAHDNEAHAHYDKRIHFPSSPAIRLVSMQLDQLVLTVRQMNEHDQILQVGIKPA